MMDNVRNFTEQEMREVVDKHIAGWSSGRGVVGRCWTWLWKFYPFKRNKLRLISTDSPGKDGFDLRIRLEIHSKATLHTKLFMLTAKWLLEQFVTDVANRSPETIRLITSLPFVQLTQDYPLTND